LKPGDPGFVYDKVVDFSKQADDGPMEDDSWGEDEEVVEDQVAGGNDNEYYDEEEDEVEAGMQDALDQ